MDVAVFSLHFIHQCRNEISVFSSLVCSDILSVNNVQRHINRVQGETRAI